MTIINVLQRQILLWQPWLTITLMKAEADKIIRFKGHHKLINMEHFRAATKIPRTPY